MSIADFDKTISDETLRYYLAHAATAQWIYLSDTLDDDIRVIKKAGIKFLGRASGIWKAEMPDAVHFAKSKEAADRIHAADSEIILQACIFEYVYREDLESTPVPAFAFEAFGLEPENRCFDFDSVCFNKNGSEGIPDISQTETQMWFYYRAVNYINAGYEAFHMGQIHLYTALDRSWDSIAKVLSMIREYGSVHARRHKVLMDAHSHSMVKNGISLLDYNAMPFTRYPIVNMPGEKLVLVREGKSGGGISPDGKYYKALPFLYEYDNWGGKNEHDHATLTYEQRAWAQWWGYDQIAWFASQSEKDRNKFLEYSFKWTAVNNPDAFFAFPLRRPLVSGEKVSAYPFYKLNNKSDNCCDGFSQEDTAARLLNEGYEKYRVYSNPQDILDYGGKDVDDPATGVRYPEKVVAYGSFQPWVGAVENDSNSEITRLYYIGGGKYMLSFIMPYAGTFDMGISTWGTLSACVCQNSTFPYSGSGGKSSFTVEEDNTIVRVIFNYMTNEINIDYC